RVGRFRVNFGHGSGQNVVVEFLRDHLAFNCLYTPRYSSANFGNAYSFRVRSRAAAPIFLEYSEFVRRFASASPSCVGSRGGTMTPDSPRASPTPPTSVATEAFAQAIPLINANGNPSDMLGSATTSPELKAFGVSFVKPMKWMESDKPSLSRASTQSCAYSRSDAEPWTRHFALGTFSRTVVIAGM